MPHLLRRERITITTMKVTNSLIAILAILAILISVLTLYFDIKNTESVESNATVQFKVGVTVSPKGEKNRKRFYDTFFDLFRRFSPRQESNF